MSHKQLICDANNSIVAAGDAGAVARFFWPEYVVNGTDGAAVVGHKGVLAYIERVRRSFSEIQVDVLILTESEDRISWMRTVSGVQTGAYLGFPASGQPIVWRDMVVSRVLEGRIAEEWVVTDLAERLLLARKVRTPRLPNETNGHNPK
jgi:predicted ester cyclase